MMKRRSGLIAESTDRQMVKVPGPLSCLAKIGAIHMAEVMGGQEVRGITAYKDGSHPGLSAI